MRDAMITTVFDAVTVPAGQVTLSSIIDMSKISGDCSAHWILTGDGTVTLDYILAHDSTLTFLKPTGASDIVAGITKSTGTSGKDITEFTPKFSKLMKIRATETGGVNPVVLTLHLCSR